MQGFYKVFKVGSKEHPEYEIFYCPSAPVHYADRRPYDERTYSTKQAAYRRCKQLNQQAAVPQNQSAQNGKTEFYSSISDSAPKTENLSSIN